MSGWIILGIAIAGYIACYRVVYRLLDEHEGSDSDDAMEKALMATMAVLISGFWPLILTGWVVWRFATPTTVRQKRAELQAMEQRRRELKQEIHSAERDLGIGRKP